MLKILDTVIVNIDSNCYGLDFIIKVIKEGLFPILQIGIPIILIVLCTFDLGKAVLSNDDKENKKILKRIIRRLIYALLLFFIVTLVSLIFSMVGNITENSNLIKWSHCWNDPIE